jgi:hypothetical protein
MSDCDGIPHSARQCTLQRSTMSMTPPKSNAGTPQRPSEPIEQKRDDQMAFSDEDDEEEVKAKEAQILEDDLLSPVTSDIGSDTERAAMEKELEEQGLIRKVCYHFRIECGRS